MTKKKAISKENDINMESDRNQNVDEMQILSDDDDGEIFTW